MQFGQVIGCVDKHSVSFNNAILIVLSCKMEKCTKSSHIYAVQLCGPHLGPPLISAGPLTLIPRDLIPGQGTEYQRNLHLKDY